MIQVVINNYHRGAAGAGRKPTNPNQQAEDGLYEEERSFEERRQEQDRISSFLGQENAWIALEKQAIAQLSPTNPNINSRRAALKDRSEKKNRMAQKLGVDRARLKAEMAESVDAPARHSRKAEYRKRNKKEQPAADMSDYSMFEQYVIDNPQLESRAALQSQVPRTPQPSSKIARSLGEFQARGIQQKEVVARVVSEYDIEQGLTSSSWKHLDQGSSFGGFQFQVPNLQQLGFGRNDLEPLGKLSHSEPDSMGVLRSLPKFNQFIPPKIPGNLNSPGYLPPSLPFFSRVVPPNDSLLGPPRLSYMPSESPTESLDSTVYNNSSWSSPVRCYTPRPVWNYSNSLAPANMDVSSTTGHLFAGAGADTGSLWLKRLTEAPDTNLSPPPELAVKQEETDVSHVLASATSRAVSFVDVEMLVVKQEGVDPADVSDLFQALNDRIEEIEKERNKRANIPGVALVKEDPDGMDLRISSGDPSLPLGILSLPHPNPL